MIWLSLILRAVFSELHTTFGVPHVPDMHATVGILIPPTGELAGNKQRFVSCLPAVVASYHWACCRKWYLSFSAFANAQRRVAVYGSTRKGRIQCGMAFCPVVNEFIVLTHLRGRRGEEQRRWQRPLLPDAEEKLVTFDDSRHTECETGSVRVNKPDRTNIRVGIVPPHLTSPRALSIRSHLRRTVTLRYRSERWWKLPVSFAVVMWGRRLGARTRRRPGGQGDGECASHFLFERLSLSFFPTRFGTRLPAPGRPVALDKINSLRGTAAPQALIRSNAPFGHFPMSTTTRSARFGELEDPEHFSPSK